MLKFDLSTVKEKWGFFIQNNGYEFFQIALTDYLIIHHFAIFSILVFIDFSHLMQFMVTKKKLRVNDKHGVGGETAHWIN